MTYERIRYAVDEAVLTVTLDREDRLNAVDPQMREELVEAFAAADRDPEVRAVVVTGSGRAFCAGADVSGGSSTFDSSSNGWASDVEEFRDGGGRIALQVFACRKPVIAAVNGVAAGLGATMLLPMDLVLASTTARFGFVFTRRGLVPEASSTWFLPRRVGMSVAAEWLYTGRMVGAEEARAAGLVRSVHEPDDLLDAAYALAHEIAQNAAPVAVAMTRQMLWRLSGAPHPIEAHRVDSRMNYLLGASPDVAEGISAFLEKRPPHFPGRVPQDVPAAYPWWDEPPFVPESGPYAARDRVDPGERQT